MEYNKLTRDLLSQGYDENNHPDYVYCDRQGLNNYHGGFQYYYWHVAKMTFETPCGIHCRYESIMNGTGYMGIDWNYENDCPLVKCPKRDADCTLKHEAWNRGEGVSKYWCNVHAVDKRYEYDGSLEQMNKLHEEDIRNKKIAFKMQKNGHICDMHMRYDPDRDEWVNAYNPIQCGRLKCKKIAFGECPVIRKQDKQKGNVYYDLKITYRRRDLDGTLFEGQIDTRIEKDKQLFDSPVNLTICKMVVNMCSDEIKRLERLRHHTELFFSNYYGEIHYYEMEVINIKAEKKVARDLEQDLADIAAGFEVVHERDAQKSEKERKSNKRKQNNEKKFDKLRKKLIDVGLENMDEYSIDYIHAMKWFDKAEIEELAEERKRKLAEDQARPEQLSLFDMMEGG